MIELIQTRLNSYDIVDEAGQDNALKEIVQEIMLFSLYDAGFFEAAAFQGGTSLRILHGLPRFSEDIDFILQEPDLSFSWQPYLEAMIDTCENFGIRPEVRDRSRMDKSVRKAVLKDNSIANQLNLSFVNNHKEKKLNIKLEIDSNPPAGSGFDYTEVKFPVEFEICHQDLSSNFTLKIHALLCRGYLKGRDWYDFNWYINQEVKPNRLLLKNALVQYGPWKGKDFDVSREWLVAALQNEIESINWGNAEKDVSKFLNEIEQKSLKLWSDRFFMRKLEKLLIA